MKCALCDVDNLSGQRFSLDGELYCDKCIKTACEAALARKEAGESNKTYAGCANCRDKYTPDHLEPCESCKYDHGSETFSNWTPKQ